MPEPKPIANHRRRVRKRALLPPDAACTECGERNPDALVAVRRTILDGHHAAGEVYDQDCIAVLCKNHHAIETARGLDAGLDLAHRELSTLARVAGALHSLALFLQSLAEALLRMARELSLLEAAFDRRYPKWRTLPEAGLDA